MRQLEFNLTPRAENRCAAWSWRYQFTKTSLVEEHDEGRIVYGLWEKLFGCWIVSKDSRRSREIVPTWQPLNENGVWRDQQKVRFSATLDCRRTLSSRWRYEANAAFAGYFSGIPRTERSLSASFGDYQWLALDLMWQEPRFVSFLDEELYNETQQYIFACCVLADAHRRPRTWRRKFADLMRTEKRTNLLGALSGIECSRAAVKAICKLGPIPCSKSVYKGLINFASHDPTVKGVHHVDRIFPNLVAVVEGLPEAWLQPNLIKVLLSDPEIDYAEPDYVEGELDKIIGLYEAAPTSLQAAISESLRQVATIGGLFRWTQRWGDRLIEVLDFPPSPIPTIKNLIPLSSAAAMKDEALQMRNCLTHLAPYVIQRRAYFFHWDDDVVPATVMLHNTSDRGWMFHKVLGVKNKPIPRFLEFYLRQVVNQATGPELGPLFNKQGGVVAV